MTEPTVLLEERGAVAVLTLNRPQALNSLTRHMHQEVWAALDKVDANPLLRALDFIIISIIQFKELHFIINRIL